MRNTSFKLEDLFGGIIGEVSISPEQITKLNEFLVKIMRIKI